MSFKNTPPSVSTKLTFPCTECNFEAQSARQLSRHKAVTHTQNALKCVLCPFVTAYQTNLLRHRKDVHGICGSKGNKSCKFCGFVSEDNDTLIQHQIEIHQDILKSAQAKFAKELVSAGGEESIADFSANFESMSEDLLNNRNSSASQRKRVKINKHNFHLESNSNKLNNNSSGNKNNNNDVIDEERNEFEEFWKAGFIEQYGDHSNYFGQTSLISINPDIQNESIHTSSRSSTPKSQSSQINMNITNNIINTINNNNNNNNHIIGSSNNSINNNSNNKDLPATRIRRQYNCNDCGFRTINPREFLYHRRDMHGYKIKIVECPYCVYACQYVQKLQRHLLLVHKLSSVMNSPSDGLSNHNHNNNKNNININNHSNNSNNINNSNSNEIDQLFVKRKYKRSRISECQENSINLDNDDERAIHHNDDFVNPDTESFEQMNNFEMNLNEYSQNDIEMAANSEEKKFLFNLECFICKIKFGDAISAQKHFIKHHKHSNYKNIMNLIKNEPTWIHGTTNQKKVFDSSAKNIHVCNFCGYKTRWISELERHVRVHSKEKPFKCPFCDFRSKWKGDLNRHIQRYHSNEQSIPDMESDTSTNNGIGHSNNGISPNRQMDDETMNDSYMNEDYEISGLVEMDEDFGGNAQSVSNDNENELSDIENDENIPAFNGNTAKMFKCTYCDFMCSTASRFHVHYVQHLNTKPFQCSICGHRSNWEWDVTKHIKMKAQRDPNHEKAQPVLIHDSGKRDYSKYNKFVIWVGQDEADMANESTKIDFRAKRFKNENDECENDNGFVMDSLLTPEVCFEVDDGDVNNDSSANEQNFNSSNENLRTNLVLSSKKSIVKSVIVSRHPESRSKIIKCSQCEFKHHFARVIVAHMSSHNRTKPYSCKHCSFETNWREVIINHCINMHKNCNPNEFEMRFRCAIDEISLCRIVSIDEVAQFEQANNSIEMITELTPAIDSNSSLIEPNIYEEKTVIRCEYCPFITTNLKKMSIHCRFHNQSKGSLKCKYCPYYVNNRDKLMRHQKLHQKVDLINRSNYVDNSTISNENTNDTNGYTNQSKRATLISCSICPFQTNNVQLFSDHMNTHHNTNSNNSGDQFTVEMNDNLLEQTLTENEFDVTANSNNSNPDFNINNDLASSNEIYGENSVSLIDVNNMKNGHAKKFSYVCNDCPAAFKSPGDYKIHAVFHSSNYPHACQYCTYKARNKPQLCKHLYVHTAEYIAKRANSYPDGTRHLIENQDGHTNMSITHCGQSAVITKKIIKQKMNKKSVRKHRTKIEFPMKPVKVKLNNEENGKQNIVFNNTDLMASQEFLETKEYLQRINSGIKNRCMYRCSKCPAVFTKVNTLIYHMTLHDQKAGFTCDSCTYSTETEDNLSIHSLLHNLTESQTALGYNFNYNCHKCPAGFSKRTRLDKHLSLHGAKFNWKCDKCDYSVRYAATLVKHRALHLINPNFQAMEYDGKDLLSNEDEDDEEGAIHQGSFGNSVLQQTTDLNDDDFPKTDLKLKLNLSKLRDKISDRNFDDIPINDEDHENVVDANSHQDDDESESYDDLNPALLMEEVDD